MVSNSMIHDDLNPHFSSVGEWMRRAVAVIGFFGLAAFWYLAGYEKVQLPTEETGSPFAVRSASEWRWQPRRVWPGPDVGGYWVRGLRKTTEGFSVTNALSVEPAAGAVLHLMPATEEGPPSIVSLFGSTRIVVEGAESKLRIGPGMARFSDGAAATVVRRALRDEWEFALDRGTATLGMGGRDIDVREGETLRFLGTGKSGKYALRSVRRLPFLPRYPAANARILYSPPLESIDFTWEGEAAPSIEIDKDPSFSAPMRIATNGGRSARAALAAGRYLWRLRADDAQSQAATVSVVPRIRYTMSVEPPSIGASKMILKWELIPFADHYQVEVSKDPRFEKNVVRSTVQEPEYAYRPKTGGAHFWRVQAMSSAWGDWSFSDSMKFAAKRVNVPAVRATSATTEGTPFQETGP